MQDGENEEKTPGPETAMGQALGDSGGKTKGSQEKSCSLRLFLAHKRRLGNQTAQGEKERAMSPEPEAESGKRASKLRLEDPWRVSVGEGEEGGKCLAPWRGKASPKNEEDAVGRRRSAMRIQSSG